MNISNESYIFKLVCVPNSTLNKQVWISGPNFSKEGISGPKQKKLTSQLNSAYSSKARFHISGQSLINENCYNSKTSNDIDMKLELLTKVENKIGNVKKIWRWCHVSKPSHHWPIWSNPEARFRTHSL